MKLKEMLHTLFDIDLPISGGNSQSIDTPIIIDKDEPSDYVGTQYAVLKYIGLLRGVTCKTVGQLLTLHNGRYIDQIKIETVKLTDE